MSVKPCDWGRGPDQIRVDMSERFIRYWNVHYRRVVVMVNVIWLTQMARLDPRGYVLSHLVLDEMVAHQPPHNMDALSDQLVKESKKTESTGNELVAVVCESKELTESKGHEMSGEISYSPCKMLFIRHWKIWPALRRLKGICRNSRKPKGEVIAVFQMSLECTGIWWCPQIRPVFEITWAVSTREVC